MVLAASRRLLVRALVIATAVLAVSCGNGGETGPVVTVGAGDSAESNLLAQIYSGALARTGARTSVVSGLGGRADRLTALDANRVQLFGEHTGALLAELDSSSDARTPAEVNQALNRALPAGTVVADAADGTDMRPRVLTTAAAGVHSVAELVAHCDGRAIGVAPVPGLLELPAELLRIPGCAAPVPLPDPAALRKALLDGSIQVGLLSGPPIDPADTDGLVVLADTEYAVRAENVIPLFRKGLLDDRRAKKLNYVAGELNTGDLSAMVRRMRDERAQPADLARDWLDQHGL
ncbi:MULTISPECIES: glycine betaine ABC transporter substrate-binding protein [unclassified Nocardia]|uniref:glycine betaine ABC transporter substrate-binding protein n=1 Tax=unclassified Nocardia TaxID=2637762 RepID=UPI001CE47E77|nr:MULTISPECIES: glycine betaine ABC transporter substrate-binding protein [unclassified Nocardia]